MPDLGEPASYLVIEPGTPVYSRDAEKLGEVEHVLADPDSDIFDGLVVDRSVLPGGHRFVDAEQVEEVFERGVLLRLDRTAAEALPIPAENPAVMGAHPGEGVPGELESKLRRAWDLISGKR